jgi:serine protease Do
MKVSKGLLFGAVLAVAVMAAVSGLVAQSRADQGSTERSRGRVMTLDGRGGQLGVVVRDLDAADLKEAAGATSGVRIDDVDQDSPAAKAGLREGDIVVELDGERVRSARQFSRLIQETPEGRSVRLGIVRGGARQTLDVTPEGRAFAFGFDADLVGRDVARSLRELEPRLREIEPRLREFRFDAPNFNFEFAPRMTSPRARLGVQLNSLTSQLAEYFGATDGGVLVSSVTPGSAAQKAGLRAGDVITSINGDRVGGADDVVDELRDVESGEVTIGIVRDKKASTIKATLESANTTMRRQGRPI